MLLHTLSLPLSGSDGAKLEARSSDSKSVALSVTLS